MRQSKSPIPSPQLLPTESLMMVAEGLLNDEGMKDPRLHDIAHFFGATLGFAYLCDEMNDPKDDEAMSGLLLETVQAALEYQRRWIREASAHGLT